MKSYRYHPVFQDQVGLGLTEIGPLFSISRSQRGEGLSSVLKNIFNYLSPYLISSGKNIVSELVRGGTNLLQDDGKPLKERVKNQLKISAANLEDKATKKLNAMREQRGFGVKKRAQKTEIIRKAVEKAKKLPKVSIKKIKSRRLPRSKQDIFDEYSS